MKQITHANFACQLFSKLGFIERLSHFVYQDSLEITELDLLQLRMNNPLAFDS